MAENIDFDDYFVPADEEHVKREKSRARKLRKSQWWKNILGRGQCHYCRERFHPGDLTMDHVVPVIRGGLSTRGNVVPCCKACNSAKTHRLPIEWDDHMDRLSGRDSGKP